MKKSHLLIQEHPLQVLPKLASVIGLEEAIVIQQLHYWLENSKNEGRIDEEGNKWVYNTYAEWKETNFPFWSEDKIQRIFLNLEKLEVVISAQLDAKRRDMKKFYRIAYDKLCAMDDAFLRPSNTPNINDVNKNTETTTENTTKPAITFDEKKLSLDWLVAGNKPVTEEKLQTLSDIDAFENMIEKEFSRFPLKWSGFRGTEQDNFRAFLKHPDQKGQKFSDFVDWWIKDEWRRENPPANIGKIIQQWPRAFSAKEKPFTPIPTVQATAEKINQPEEKYVKMPDEVRAKLNKLNSKMEIR